MALNLKAKQLCTIVDAQVIFVVRRVMRQAGVEKHHAKSVKGRDTWNVGIVRTLWKPLIPLRSKAVSVKPAH